MILHPFSVRVHSLIPLEFLDVFKQIVGPGDLRHVNSLLADITVVRDSKGKDGALSCSAPNIDAELIDSNTDNPMLVVCPRAFTRGASSAEGYPGAPVVTCDRCCPRIYKNMEVSPTGFSATSTVDSSFGAFLTRLENRAVAPKLAIWNGNGYAWPANEVWWTQACVDSHGALTVSLRGDS